MELGPFSPRELAPLWNGAHDLPRRGWTLRRVPAGSAERAGSLVEARFPRSRGREEGPKGTFRSSDELPDLAVAALGAVDRYGRREKRYLRMAHGRRLLLGGRTVVMGIVNVTPDSFFDGGRFSTTEAAVEHALRLAAEGASLLDIGGESTRPGAPRVSEAEELRRVLPLLRALRRRLDVPLSVDTRKWAVAHAALRAGASVVNDVGGLGDARMRREVARADAAAVVMHMRGDPRTMQRDTRYADMRGEVFRTLWARARQAQVDGVGADQLVVDPGLGFGKSAEGSLELLLHVAELRALGLPVLIGASRKSFLRAIGGGELPEERLQASVAAAVLAGQRGADIVRVHDVAPTVAALRVVETARGGGRPGR